MSAWRLIGIHEEHGCCWKTMLLIHVNDVLLHWLLCFYNFLLHINSSFHSRQAEFLWRISFLSLFNLWPFLSFLVVYMCSLFYKHSLTSSLLGLDIDPSLSWSSHLAYLRKNSLKHVAFLACIKEFLPVKYHIILINVSIKPILEYFVSIWGSCNARLFDEIF